MIKHYRDTRSLPLARLSPIVTPTGWYPAVLRLIPISGSGIDWIQPSLHLDSCIQILPGNSPGEKSSSTLHNTCVTVTVASRLFTKLWSGLVTKLLSRIKQFKILSIWITNSGSHNSQEEVTCSREIQKV